MIKVVDLTENPDEYNFRPTSTSLAHQLECVDEFNKNLPPKKKKKESLPQFSVTNVTRKTL
jgi:hypothetical protein